MLFRVTRDLIRFLRTQEFPRPLGLVVGMVLGLAGVVYLPGWVMESEWMGRRTAMHDLAEGRFRIRGLGPPGRAQLLQERYGIESQSVGCVRLTNRHASEDAYNAVQRAAMVQRFGRDVVEECDQEARQMRLRSAQTSP